MLAAGNGLEHGDLVVSIGGAQVFLLSEHSATLLLPTSAASRASIRASATTDQTARVVATVAATNSATLKEGLLGTSVSVGSLLSPLSGAVYLGADAPYRA